MTARSKDWIIRAAGLAALLAGVGFVLLRPPQLRPAASGAARAPAFTAPTLLGDTVSLTQFRGRVVVLNFWATWCGPCKMEIPALQRLYREMGPRGLAVVAVSEDEDPPGKSPVKDIGSFAVTRGMTFPILLDPTGRIQDLYGVRGIPTTFLLDRDGRVIRQVIGPAAWDSPPYSQQISQLLAGGR